MAVEVTGYRRYRSDMAAWLAVQPSLARLHSELQREPARELTVQIAAAPLPPRRLHACVSIDFRANRARLRPPNVALAYLEIAADGAQDIRTWKSMTAYSEVTRFCRAAAREDAWRFLPI